MRRVLLVEGVAGNDGVEVRRATVGLRSQHPSEPLRFFLTRLYDWLTTPEGAMVTKKDPLEYLRKLRFHRQIGSAAEYGLSL